MKVFFLLLCVCIEADVTLCQAVVESIKSIDSTTAIVPSDSVRRKQGTAALKEERRELAVTVYPREANDASITVIRTSKLRFLPNVSTEYECPPDTVARLTLPLSIYLALGNYDLLIKKEGFKSVLQKTRIAKKQKDSIAIEMYSLDYLQHKNEQWSTVKWTAAGIAMAMGVATYCIHAKIQTLQNEYDDALSSSVIEDKRNHIARYQHYYTISSAATFTFIGGFGLSWMIQDSY